MASSIDSRNEELQSAYLYKVMAEHESQEKRRRLFTELGKAAEDQAVIWTKKITEETGSPPPDYHDSLRTKIVAKMIRTLGPRAIQPVLAAMKVRGLSIYSQAGLSIGHRTPTHVEEIGHRHELIGAGGNLRAAVFGINDGLVSNVSLIMGVAGATMNLSIILLTGMAGLLAGAFSMGAGEYISVRSQRELYEYQIDLEREELEEYPEEEAEELALIYNARGLPMDKAREIANELIQDKEHALDVLTREELGLNPDNLGSPWGAAISSFISFTCGAIVPLIPFLLGMTEGAIVFSGVLSAMALFTVGAVLSLFTGKSALKAGMRMLLIGTLAGAATFLLGSLLGIGVA